MNSLNPLGYLADRLRGPNLSVLIDTTNGCNLRCAFCPRDNGKVTQMSAAELETILERIHRRTATLQLSCAWEYSIAKNAAEIVHTVGRYKFGSVAIYSNGNILTDDIARALVEARVNDFVVSIGEARPETYQRLRKGGKFERVIANVRRLDRLKKERNSTLPKICANLTLIRSNLCELVEFIDLAHSLGVEAITGRHLILNEGLDMSGEVVTDQSVANTIIDEAEKKALAYGMSFTIPRYTQNPEPKRCRAPWHQLYISCNGDVSVCPRIHRHETIGNLLVDTFERIRTGKNLAALKRQFETNSFSNPICGICMENRETEQPIDQGF